MDFRKYIQAVNKEFENNGRSELFVKAEQAVIDTGNPIMMVEFASGVKNGADIEALANAVIASKNSSCIYAFARDVKGANIKPLEEAIIKNKDTSYVIEFIKHIDGANVELLQQFIIDSKYVKGCIQIANACASKEGVDLIKLGKLVAKYGTAEDIYNFSTASLFVDRALMQQAIINRADPEYLYKFSHMASDFKGLEQAMINSGSAQYCYYFAMANKKSDVLALQKAVMKTGELNYCISFANNIEGADIEAVYNMIKNNPKYHYQAEDMKERIIRKRHSNKSELEQMITIMNTDKL